MSRSMEELVCLAKKNDEEAIAALYEQTYNSVYQSVRAVIKDEDEALDIVQDSYIKGFQSLDKLEDPTKYQAWMKRMASNMAIDYLRKKKPVLFSERIDEDGEEIDLRHQDDCLEHMPEEVIDRQETTRLMNDILGTLKAEQRLAVVMYYYEEMSVREIAETLGCSENTIKSRLKYARDKIETEVRKLEKKGTKLYSLAPMSFFTWLLRMAKENGISFVRDGADAGMAIGTTAAGGTAVATGSAAATAGETAAAAGSTASGSAAGAAAKVAGGIAGKTLATKIIASTLAVTMTLGIGAAAVNHMNKEKENEEAHAIYEEFLDGCKSAFEMDHEEFLSEHFQFYYQIYESIRSRPCDEILPNGAQKYRLVYISGDTFLDGTPVPQAQFKPPMLGTTLWPYHEGAELKLEYAFHDITGDGVDELLFKSYSPENTKIAESDINVYTVKDGILCFGCVSRCDSNGAWSPNGHMWTINPKLASTYVFDIMDGVLIEISYGTDAVDADAFGQKIWKDNPCEIGDDKWVHFVGNIDSVPPTIHEHIWSDATCTSPKTCSTCGETEGMALDHQWMAATTVAPKTCSLCGATEGSPILDIVVGDTITMGHYGNEDIVWTVLEFDPATNQALVISKYCIEAMPFHAGTDYGSWENSTLRKWLNNDFISKAFSQDERATILTTTISNPDNMDYGTDSGGDTSDRVFLLSYEEAVYYFPSKTSRQGTPTKYCKEQGCYDPVKYAREHGKECPPEEVGHTWWWLRTAGHNDEHTCNVISKGTASTYGAYKTSDEGTVRPVMRVQLG